MNMTGSSISKKPTQTRRTVRMLADRATETKMNQSDNNEELEKKVRDVFEALEMPERRHLDANPNRIDEEKSENLQKEVEGVDAVIMIVDRNEVSFLCTWKIFSPRTDEFCSSLSKDMSGSSLG